MLRTRLITALSLLPILIASLVCLSKVAVCLILGMSVFLSMYEIGAMVYPSFADRLIRDSQTASYAPRFLGVTGPWFCTLVGTSMFFLTTMVNLSGTERGNIISFFSLIILFGTLTASKVELAIANTSSLLVCLCYGCLPWVSVWDLYLMGDHAKFVLLLLAIVMMGDTGAFFFGRKYGRHLLAPKFSPKKTWEGVFGGLVFSILGATGINMVFSWTLGPSWLIVMIAIVAGTAGVMGDLVESSFKRFAGVKDSGTLLPGHGGFLDRFDSLLFASPIAWLILYSYKNFSS